MCGKRPCQEWNTLNHSKPSRMLAPTSEGQDKQTRAQAGTRELAHGCLCLFNSLAPKCLPSSFSWLRCLSLPPRYFWSGLLEGQAHLTGCWMRVTFLCHCPRDWLFLQSPSKSGLALPRHTGQKLKNKAPLFLKPSPLPNCTPKSSESGDPFDWDGI